MKTHREEMLKRQVMENHKNIKILLDEVKEVAKSYNRMRIALSCSVFVNVVLVLILLGLLTR